MKNNYCGVKSMPYSDQNFYSHFQVIGRKINYHDTNNFDINSVIGGAVSLIEQIGSVFTSQARENQIRQRELDARAYGYDSFSSWKDAGFPTSDNGDFVRGWMMVNDFTFDKPSTSELRNFKKEYAIRILDGAPIPLDLVQQLPDTTGYKIDSSAIIYDPNSDTVLGANSETDDKDISMTTVIILFVVVSVVIATFVLLYKKSK